MAKRIILKSETQIKNSAVGFSYITVYFGSLVPLFRLDIIGFLEVLLSEILVFVICVLMAFSGSIAIYALMYIGIFLYRIYLGFWYNKSYTRRLLLNGLVPADEYSKALLMLYGYIPIDNTIDIVKYKIIVDSGENVKAIIFIISQIIGGIFSIISIIEYAVLISFFPFATNIFSDLKGKNMETQTYEQTQNYSENTQNSTEDTSQNTESTTESTDYTDDDLTTADTVYDEVINKGNYDYLNNFNKDELGIIRNTFYARRGYIFTDVKYKEYFSKKSWYKPSTYVMDILPPKEKEIVRIIKEYENSY